MKKNLLKKLVTLLLVVTLTLTQMSLSVFASQFSQRFLDINGHYAETVIKKWVNDSLISGLHDGSFSPDRNITRAEFVALMNRAFKFEEPGMVHSSFDDVVPSNWYYDDVMLASNLGIVSGYPDGKFGAEHPISRQDACVIVSRYLSLTEVYDVSFISKFKDKDSISDYAVNHVVAMAEMSYVNGRTNGDFAPKENITRADSVVMLDNVYKTLVGSSGITGRIYFDNRILPDANITITRSDEFLSLATFKSDPKGDFAINLDEGEYDVIVSKDDYVTYKSRLTVDNDKKTFAKFTLEQGQMVSGVLREHSGKELADTPLYLKTNPYFAVVTDAKGYFNVVLPINKNFELFSFREGAMESLRPFYTNDETKELDLGEVLVNSESMPTTSSEYSSTEKNTNPSSHTLTIIESDGGTIEGSFSNKYYKNTIISLNAISQDGYKFVGWTTSNGGIFESSTNSNTSFIMPGNATTISARFELDNEECSRGEWIDILMKKMNMSYHNLDGEFSYFYGDTENSVYGDLIETVNVIGILPPPDSIGYHDSNHDIPLFRPDEVATREFVAYTVAKALGFLGNYELVYDDSVDVEYPSEVAVVIQTGILYLQNNKFNPTKAISFSDKEQVLSSIDSFNDSVKIDSSEFQDSVAFQDNVIAITEEDYLITDIGNQTYSVVLVSNTETDDILTGSIVVLPPNSEYVGGIALKVSSIEESNGRYIILCSEPELGEVISDFSFAGYAIANLENMSVANDVLVEYNPNGAIISGSDELSTFEIGTVTNPGKAIFTVFEKYIGDTGVKVSGNIEIGIPTVVVKAEGNVTLFDGMELDELTVSINREVDVSANLEYDFGVPEASYDISTGKQTFGNGKIELGKIPFALGASGFTLDLVVFINVDVSGKVSISFSIDETSGIQYKNGILRELKDYDTEFNLLELNATAKIGLGLAIRLTLLSIYDLAGIDAHGGVGVTAKFTPHFDANPNLYCAEASIYMYATLEIDNDTLAGEFIQDVLDLKLVIEIYDEDSSPFKRKLHIENGLSAPKCTYGNGTLFGIINDASTSIPISGARVLLYNEDTNTFVNSYYSDVIGEFHTKELPTGNYRMKVMATGYESYNQYVTVQSNKQKYCDPSMLIKRVDIIDDSEISVQFHIKNSSTSDGVNGVEYSIRAGWNKMDGDPISTGIFDSEYGTVALISGYYTVEFSIDDFNTNFMNVLILSNVENSYNVKISSEIKMPDPQLPVVNGRLVSGKITIKDEDFNDTNNLALSNVSVELIRIDTLEKVQQETDLSGNFMFDDIKNGDYVIKISIVGYSSETSFIEISDDYYIDFQLVREGTRKIDISSITSTSDTIFGINNYGEVYVWGLYNPAVTGIECEFTHFNNDYDDGSYFTADIINKPTKIESLKNIIQIETHGDENVMMAVDANGDLWQWGSINSRYSAGIFGNGDHSTTLSFQKPTKNSKISDVNKVAVSLLNSYVLKSDGTVWTTGNLEVSGLYDYNADYSNSGFYIYDYTIVDGLSGIVDIVASVYGFYALDNEGNLWAVGPDWIIYTGKDDHYLPQLVLSDIKSISASTTSYLSTALANNGDLYAWGSDNDSFIPAIILQDVKYSKVLNSESFIAIKEEGSIWGYGGNSNGELGDGTNEDKQIPTQVMSGLTEVFQIIPLGYSNTLIELIDGIVYVTGDNQYGAWGGIDVNLNWATSVPVPITISID